MLLSNISLLCTSGGMYRPEQSMKVSLAKRGGNFTKQLFLKGVIESKDKIQLLANFKQLNNSSS